MYTQLLINLKEKPTELRSIICHIGSHQVTCHSKQVNAPRPVIQVDTRFSHTPKAILTLWPSEPIIVYNVR